MGTRREQLTLDITGTRHPGEGEFHVSPANAEAVAMIEADHLWPGGRLVICGPEGAGKSHLAAIWAARRGGRVITAEALARSTPPGNGADAAPAGAGCPSAREGMVSDPSPAREGHPPSGESAGIAGGEEPRMVPTSATPLPGAEQPAPPAKGAEEGRLARSAAPGDSPSTSAAVAGEADRVAGATFAARPASASKPHPGEAAPSPADFADHSAIAGGAPQEPADRAEPETAPLTRPDLLAETAGIVVEDIDRIAGDPVAEEALFHLFNAAVGAGTPLLMTCRRPPARLPFALPDLSSRLAACHLVTLSPPDDALLAAVLIKLFAERQIAPPPGLIRWLLPRMERSFAAARALVAEIDRIALAEGRPVGRTVAARALDKLNAAAPQSDMPAEEKDR